MCIFSELLVNNDNDPFAHKLRFEHAKNAGFGSKHSFCNLFWHDTTNSILNFWYLFPEPVTYKGANAAIIIQSAIESTLSMSKLAI